VAPECPHVHRFFFWLRVSLRFEQVPPLGPRSFLTGFLLHEGERAPYGFGRLQALPSPRRVFNTAVCGLHSEGASPVFFFSSIAKIFLVFPSESKAASMEGPFLGLGPFISFWFPLPFGGHGDEAVLFSRPLPSAPQFPGWRAPFFWLDRGGENVFFFTPAAARASREKTFVFFFLAFCDHNRRCFLPALRDLFGARTPLCAESPLVMGFFGRGALLPTACHDSFFCRNAFSSPFLFVEIRKLYFFVDFPLTAMNPLSLRAPGNAFFCFLADVFPTMF